MNARRASVAEVYLESPEVSFGHDRTSASVRFHPNYRALADDMFEVMDQLGEVEGSDSAGDAN